MEGGRLRVRTLFAMPLGPPRGGMTEYAAMLRSSSLFEGDQAIIFDTTPAQDSSVRGRVIHALRGIARLARVIRHERIKVAYFMTSSYLGFYEKGLMALVARFMGVRCVLHPVGNLGLFYRGARVGRPMVRIILRRVDRVIAVHPDAREEIRALAPQTQIECIPNPVDVRRFLPVGKRLGVGTIQVLYAGSLTKMKGVLDLIHAVRLRLDDLPSLRVVIIGGGDLEEECLELVSRYGLESVIEIKGFVNDTDKAHLFESSDVFCLPSYSEGMPLSVLEAMACGVAVISSKVGGVHHVINHEYEGLLFEAGDVAALGDCIVRLASDEPLRRAMGKRGRERVVQAFSLDSVAAQIAATMNSLAVDVDIVESEVCAEVRVTRPDHSCSPWR